MAGSRREGGAGAGGQGRDRRAGTKQSGDRTLDARGAAIAASLGKPEEREEEREEQGRRTGWRRTRGVLCQSAPLPLPPAPPPERVPASCEASSKGLDFREVSASSRSEA